MPIIDKEQFQVLDDIVKDMKEGDALSQVVKELMVPEMIQSLDVLKLHLERTCQCKIMPGCLPCAIKVLVFGGEMNRKSEPKSSIILPGTDIKKPATVKPHFRMIK